ncbi:hypothetical protein [Paracoccus denitrificans]|uniref:hypothetical protein n=1 Tax=Paracoccus denitrificans TaxID=266 RepID=UPI000CEBD3D0|nr:hypothetical protein [Paracoccus denitrificans]
MFLRQGLVAFLAICPVSAAWAVPATEEGALRLRGVFQTYFGGTEGVVSVTPQGESYELRIDPAPLLAQVPAEQAQVSVSALTYQLTDNGDGSWGVSEDQTFSWSVVVPKMFEQKGSTKVESTGIWDEALMSFREQTSVMTDYVIDSVQYAPPLAPDPEAEAQEPPAEPQVISRDHQRTARMEMSLTGAPGKAGGVDQAMSFTAEGLEQSQEILMGPGGQPMQIQITAPGYDGSGQITGARTEGMLSLLAWFVAHPSGELIKGSQDALRDKLSAAMPLWDDLSMDATVRDLKIGSPLGEFGLASTKVTIGMSGATPDGRLQEQVALSGVTVPEGVLPSWVAPILPQEVTLDFTASDFDLAAPARMLIEGFDLTAEEPFAKLVPEQLQAALLPRGSFDLKLAPSQIKGDGYQIDYRADVAAGPAAPPSGSALITATGLDKVEEALAAAPPEQAGQPLMMLRMARAMAKPGASGENVWDIQMPEGGGPFTINGQPMGPATSQP